MSEAISVSRLVACIRETVEDNFVEVLVRGELSNYSLPSSGHAYFTLKDSGAQIRCVMFRMHQRLLKFIPQEGMEVVCAARATLYPQRGDLQLVVERMDPIGVGAEQIAFDQLMKKLAAEGMFAEAAKRPLPLYPRVAGVVTSATGAAIQDVVRVMSDRGAAVELIISPALVQGAGAAASIISAIGRCNRYSHLDVLIIGRGGGSAEDLSAFNDEGVARAIFQSPIPTISAVGHEVDWTIADHVADRRAATPSAAAEMLCKGREELESTIDQYGLLLNRLVENRLSISRERVNALGERIDQNYRTFCDRLRFTLQRESDRLHFAIEKMNTKQHNDLDQLGLKLDTLSPLKILQRGYSVVSTDRGGVVTEANSLETGDIIKIQFANGEKQAEILGDEK